MIKSTIGKWIVIDKAPKDGTPILAINKFNEQRVVEWCNDYPRHDGVWSYARCPTDYIDKVLEFNPTHYVPLPSPER